MTDNLRTLAQAADAAFEAWRSDPEPLDALRGACEAAEVALGRAMGVSGPLLWPACLRILAALDAERDAADAQGYARAMGEVEERAEERCVKRRQQADAAEERSPGRAWLLACVIEASLMRDWAKRARERATAAEKERGE